MNAIDVRLVTPGRWDDVVDLFERRGPRGGAPVTRGCWCQFWHLRGTAYDLEQGDANRARLRAQIEADARPCSGTSRGSSRLVPARAAGDVGFEIVRPAGRRSIVRRDLATKRAGGACPETRSGT